MAIDTTDFSTTWPELVVNVDFVSAAPAPPAPPPNPVLEAQKIRSAIDRAQNWYIKDATFYGVDTDRARLLLSAHLYAALRGKERHGADGVGPVSSRTIENSSISYGNQTFDEVQQKLLSTTSYGRELVDLNLRLSGCATAFTA